MTSIVVHGGCVCEGVRYTITFPPDHDFSASARTCQCEQCRKNTGALIMPSQILPASAVKLTSQTTLRRYYASPGIARGFCGTCGGLVFWQREGGDTINVTLGSLDKAHLIEHGERLTSGTTHYWCDAMIPGATDNLRGEKWKGYSFGEGAELVP